MKPNHRTLVLFGCGSLAAVLLAFLLSTYASDSRVWTLVRNSLLLAAATCVISLPIGTLLALLITRTDLPGRRAFAVLIGSLLLVPLYLQAAAWDAGFGQLGWFSLSRGQLAEPLLDGWRAAIWIHSMASVPWVVAIVGVGLRLGKAELEEEALLDGSACEVFWRVTFKRIMACVFVAAMWILISTAGEMTITDMYQVRTYAEELYLTSQFDLDEARGGATAGISAIAFLALIGLLTIAAASPPDDLSSLRPPRVFPLGRWRTVSLIAVTLAVCVFVGVPLINLIYKAGYDVQQVGAERMRSWSAAKTLQTIANTPQRFRSDFLWTAGIGAAAATVTLAIAVPLAWLARGGGLRSLPGLCVAAISMSVPGPVFGLLVIWLFNREGAPWLTWLYDRSILAPTLTMTLRALPLAFLVAWYALRSISREELEAASSEGAGKVTRLVRIGLAQRVAAIAVVWLLALILCTGDLAASILVVPPGVDLVSVRVFTLVHAGVDEQVAGICLISLIAYFATACVIAIFLERVRFGRMNID